MNIEALSLSFDKVKSLEQECENLQKNLEKKNAKCKSGKARLKDLEDTVQDLKGALEKLSIQLAEAKREPNTQAPEKHEEGQIKLKDDRIHELE